VTASKRSDAHQQVLLLLPVVVLLVLLQAVLGCVHDAAEHLLQRLGRVAQCRASAWPDLKPWLCV
jgi:hypothetical protein